MSIQLDIFVRHPGYALIPGCFFLCVGFLLSPSARKVGTTAHRTSTAVGVIWIIYSFYEFLMGTFRMNIRADLGFIYPLLGIVSVAAALHLSLFPNKPKK